VEDNPGVFPQGTADVRSGRRRRRMYKDCPAAVHERRSRKRGLLGAAWCVEGIHRMIRAA
jgi:hypothetical protein